MFAIEKNLETGSFSADNPREEPGFGSTVEVSSIGEPLAVTHSKNGKQRDYPSEYISLTKVSSRKIKQAFHFWVPQL